jgi:hypothetical protein
MVMHQKNDNTKPKGFGAPSKPERVRIPDTPFWAQWRELLHGGERVLAPNPENAKLRDRVGAAIELYTVWEATHADFTGQPPTKGERRIAQQIFADYLGSSVENFRLLLKSFKGSSLNLEGSHE